MDLTPEQKTVIGEWAARGDNLSDIQKQIKNEFNIPLTYMDVRLLVLELEVAIADKVDPAEARKKAEAEKAATQEDAVEGDSTDSDQELPAGDSTVSVELDTVVVPGALVSGSVVFSDGVKATWALDQMGRLSLGASDPGYQPNPQDIEVFQLELQKLLQQKGF